MGGPSLEVADAANDLQDASGGAEAPSLVRTVRLQGGCLLEIWKENAKRSKMAYRHWLAELAGVGGDTSTPLEAHYSKVAAALTSAEEESHTGPWGALHAAGSAGRETRQLVLDA